MEPEQAQPHSHLFMLRLWAETLGGGECEWRGRIQHIASGESVYFRDWPGLITVLQRMLEKPTGNEERQEPQDTVSEEPLTQLAPDSESHDSL